VGAVTSHENERVAKKRGEGETVRQSMDLSIIIVNYNTAEDLGNCLRSVLPSAARLDLEILVVDNASPDASVDMVRREFPEVRLVCNDRNLGFPAANNQALPLAEGRYILLLNPDTVVPPGSLERLVLFMDQNPHCGVCGPVLVDAKGEVAAEIRRPSPWRWLLQALRLQRFYLRPVRGGPAEAVSGSCLAFRRCLAAEVGELDEGLFWAEDVDFCLRAARAGYGIAVVPDCRVTHIGGRSARTNRAEALRRQYLSALGFFHKHGSPAEVRGALAVLVGELVVKTVVWGVVAQLRPQGEAAVRRSTYASLIPELWRLQRRPAKEWASGHGGWVGDGSGRDKGPVG
jgi:hypothetical protein